MPQIPPFARFWMVARKPTRSTDKSQPRQRYDNIDDARRVARDLARQNDHPFIVLETVEIFRPGDPAETGDLFNA